VSSPRPRRALLVALLASFSLALAGAAQAATLYVHEPGKGCDFAEFTDIQEAIDAASPGDTIQICRGTYVPEDTLVIPPDKPNLHLRVHYVNTLSYPPGTRLAFIRETTEPRGDGESGELLRIQAPGTVITGLQFQTAEARSGALPLSRTAFDAACSDRQKRNRQDVTLVTVDLPSDGDTAFFRGVGLAGTVAGTDSFAPSACHDSGVTALRGRLDVFRSDVRHLDDGLIGPMVVDESNFQINGTSVRPGIPSFIGENRFQSGRIGVHLASPAGTAPDDLRRISVRNNTFYNDHFGVFGERPADVQFADISGNRFIRVLVNVASGP
jgi:hypothetical protein